MKIARRGALRAWLLVWLLAGTAATSFVPGAWLLGCAYPESSTRAVEDSPSLQIHGAPKDALLMVDGILVGPARDYSEEKTVKVLPGRHVVELSRNGQVMARREIFVDAQGIKTLDFTGVGQ